MKFILDVNVRASVGRFLEEDGHDVRYLAGSPEKTLSDSAVLALAVAEGRILVTNDRDFGELIFLQEQKHCGVVYFRIDQERASRYQERFEQVLRQYGDVLHQKFVVIGDHVTRVR